MGTKFNKMTCTCERSNEKGKDDKGKFVNDLLDKVDDWETEYDSRPDKPGNDGNGGDDGTTDERPPPDDSTGGTDGTDEP